MSDFFRFKDNEKDINKNNSRSEDEEKAVNDYLDYLKYLMKTKIIFL
jgi:hypothetical protein